MKKYIISFSCFILMWMCGCHEEKLPLYEGTNYIQFIKNLATDSTTVAFLFAPGASELDSFLIVKMTGAPYTQDMDYRITVDKQSTTMEEGKHFKLSGRTYFKAGCLRDTLPITFFRTEEMKEKTLRLVLRLEANDTFDPGQEEYCYKVFRVHDMISQPDWWTNDVTLNYLGVYSDLKYEYFMVATNGADLTGASASKIRACALMLKYWLEEQKILTGKPVTEENGDVMKVAVNG